MIIVPGSAFIPKQRIAGVDYDPYWSDVVLLMRMDTASFLDEKGHTIYINASPTSVSGKFGNSLLVDDNADVLSTDALSDFDLASTDSTVEWWVKRTDSGAKIVFFIPAHFYISTDPNDYLQISTWSGETYTTNTSSTTLTADSTWHHLAYVRDGSNEALYLDGVSILSSGRVGMPSSNQYICFPSGFPTGNATMQGYYDELRVTRAARYTSDFTPPTAPFPNS